MKLYELKSPDEVIELEKELDAMFAPLGFDVTFTSHFIQRILGREQKVSKELIASTFRKLKSKYKQRLLSAKKKPDYEAILQDLDSYLNIVFSISPRAGKPEYKLTNITIKQKPPKEFVANLKGGDILKVGNSLKETFYLSEMTLSYGIYPDKVGKEVISFMQQNGKFHGRSDDYEILYTKHDTNHTYGITDDDGDVVSVLNFTEHKPIDNKDTLEFRNAYTLPEWQNKQMVKRILFFVKGHDKKNIIDYGAQSTLGIDFMKSLGKTGRFTMYWYNIQTGKKEPYDYKSDNPKLEPYRSHIKATDWRILIEGKSSGFHRFHLSNSLVSFLELPYNAHLHDLFPYSIEEVKSKEVI